MRKLFLIAILTAVAPASAVTIERIAAVLDQQVITVTEVGQMAEVRFFPRPAGQSDDDYRREILESLIAQALRLRDVERFGAPDVPLDAIEARLQQIEGRFPSLPDFEAALVRAELTIEQLRAVIKRQLQVELYIQERFAPLMFISNEEIEEYHRGPFSEQRRARGLGSASLEQVREEIREILRTTRLSEEVGRWTSRLRLRANVDIYAWR